MDLLRRKQVLAGHHGRFTRLAGHRLTHKIPVALWVFKQLT
jgi:hypothetical protein